MTAYPARLAQLLSFLVQIHPSSPHLLRLLSAPDPLTSAYIFISPLEGGRDVGSSRWLAVSVFNRQFSTQLHANQHSRNRAGPVCINLYSTNTSRLPVSDTASARDCYLGPLSNLLCNNCESGS